MMVNETELRRRSISRNREHGYQRRNVDKVLAVRRPSIVQLSSVYRRNIKSVIKTMAKSQSRITRPPEVFYLSPAAHKPCRPRLIGAGSRRPAVPLSQQGSTGWSMNKIWELVGSCHVAFGLLGGLPLPCSSCSPSIAEYRETTPNVHDQPVCLSNFLGRGELTCSHIPVDGWCDGRLFIVDDVWLLTETRFPKSPT
jgi:hypothetical protein